jgi:hypothetical protein
MLDCIGAKPTSGLAARAAAVGMSTLTDYAEKRTTVQTRLGENMLVSAEEFEIASEDV